MALKIIGRFHKPKEGEVIITEHGRARIVRILFYADVIAEMKHGGASIEEIRSFDTRVEHFLGRKSRYFECDLLYPDGKIVRLDWSEYLAAKYHKLG
jgi:hypothetical protein